MLLATTAGARNTAAPPPDPSGGPRFRTARTSRLLAACVAMAISPNEGRSEAFPGAMGYGRHADGWRGGEVVRIDTLADDGPGSLRACAEGGAHGRVCVFAIGGDIVVDRPIRVGSNVYIAGQTAPGQGVQLRLGQAWRSPLMVIGSHDVLIRFLKLRPGPGARPGPSVSGILVEGSRDVYLDRLSIAFATDQNLSVHAAAEPARDITIARSIAAWGLERSNHPKGAHSKGALICSSEFAGGECGRVSMLFNLFANNRDRNPEIKATVLGPVEILGNVMYNGGSAFAEIANDRGDVFVTFAGNVAVAGPATRVGPKRPPTLRAERRREDAAFVIHASDNLAVTGRGCAGPPPAEVQASDREILSPSPPEATTIPIPKPEDALIQVLSTAGARSAAMPADALDSRLLEEIARCDGRIVDAPHEAGGWPTLPLVVAPPDGDGDGMPDHWERGRPGHDPADSSDAWADADGDGWSNLEGYLSHLAGDVGARAQSARGLP